MPLEVSPGPFQMQLPYTPKFVPETLPPGAGSRSGPESVMASAIIPPNPGGVATPHRAIPALAEAGYTAPSIRGGFDAGPADIGPYGPGSAGGSMYGGMTGVPFPHHPMQQHMAQSVYEEGWESASLPAPRPPRISTVRLDQPVATHQHRHLDHRYEDDAGPDASYYARPRIARHRSSSSASSYISASHREPRHHRSGSTGQYGRSSRSPHPLDSSYSPVSPSPLALGRGKSQEPVASPLSPRGRYHSREMQKRDSTKSERDDNGSPTDIISQKRDDNDHATQHDGRLESKRKESFRREGKESGLRGNMTSDGDEIRLGREPRPSNIQHHHKQNLEGKERRGRNYESEREAVGSRNDGPQRRERDKEDRRNEYKRHEDRRNADEHDKEKYNDDKVKRRDDSDQRHHQRHHSSGRLEPPDMDVLSVRERVPRRSSISHSSHDHSHHHRHAHKPQWEEHHRHSPPPTEFPVEDPCRRRATSMQFDYPVGLGPTSDGIYQTPSVAGGGQAELYDDGASIAGSGMTFMDGQVGGRTSQYGLPKYAHQMKPDYRRFCVQRGTADVYLD